MLAAQLGYSALFGVIFAESAGLPVPGESALLAAGVMAGAGGMSLPLVIAIAAGAAAMPWRRFALYNVAGAVCWCVSLASVAALAGPAGAASISIAGLVVTAGGAFAAAIRALLARRRAAAAPAVA